MRLLDYIEELNRWEPAHFIPFEVDGLTLGRVRPEFAARLATWREVFRCDPKGLHLAPGLSGFDARTRAVAGVLEALVAEGALPYLHGERYPVGLERHAPRFLMDRAAVPFFGVRAYGQHLNGYVRRPDGLWMWLARRAGDRRHYPGRLDQLAAGGLPHGLTLAENLAKECAEEAGMPAALAAAARPVGTLTYCRETDTGLKPDTIYCYDLELPEGFEPCNTDGEVAEFELLPLTEVEQRLREDEVFKPNCGLVVIDFLIRHGRLDPERADYPALVCGLHRLLP